MSRSGCTLIASQSRNIARPSSDIIRDTGGESGVVLNCCWPLAAHCCSAISPVFSCKMPGPCTDYRVLLSVSSSATGSFDRLRAVHPVPLIVVRARGGRSAEASPWSLHRLSAIHRVLRLKIAANHREGDNRDSEPSGHWTHDSEIRQEETIPARDSPPNGILGNPYRGGGGVSPGRNTRPGILIRGTAKDEGIVAFENSPADANQQ